MPTDSFHAGAAPEAALGPAAMFRAFFDQGTHYAAILAPDGTVLDANRRALAPWGGDAGDVVGRKFWDCMWWEGEPAAAAAVRAGAGQAAAGAVFRGHLPYRTPGRGGRFTDVVISPLRAADGSIVMLSAIGADATERRRAAERLRLLDAIGEATRIASEPKAILDGATRLLGEHLDATRVAYADLEPDNDRFTIRHDWTVPGESSTVGVYSLDLFGSRATSNLRAGRTLLISDVDTELAQDDGAAMFNAIGIKAIICCPLVKGGSLVAMMAVHQRDPRAWSPDDVALVEAVVERCWAHVERVRSTEALRAADRHKSEFLATLAHELRNPLAPIRNGLDLLRIGAGRPAAMATVRQMMERQVGHMVHLIDDLLDIARVSTGKVVLQVERTDLQSVVGSAVETSMPLVEAAGHRLAVHLPETPVWLDVDLVRMSQVLSNLLSNAAKYTPGGGRITVDGALEGGEVVIRVADTGIGIAQDAMGSIFDMFTQVSRSLDRSKGGLGIGLSLVRHLVGLHGGTVAAASAGPGLGSTFTLRLPAAAGARIATGAWAGGSAAPAASGALDILVADDNVDAADSLAALLRAGGHIVRTVYDGEEALRIARACPPRLAFLDIGMPRMDGYATARAFRAAPELAAVRLVALTGWGAEEDRARSHEAGFDHHLLKPAAPGELAAILAGIARVS